MSINNNSLRIIPRASDFLDRKLGSRGEIFFDQTTNTLRLYDGVLSGGHKLAKADFSNISNSDFLAKANAAGFSGGVQAGVAGKIAYYPSTGSQVNDLTELAWTANTSTLALTGTITVTGQKNRIRFHWDTLADLIAEVSPVDYHGMVAHVHDTGKLYYAHAGAWVPVAAESSLPNTFSTIAIAGQSSVVADSTSDTLTLTAGVGITLTTNAGTDTITITGTASTGNITFAGNTIDSTDSAAIIITPLVSFESDVVVGNDIVFADGSRQTTSAAGATGNITFTGTTIDSADSSAITFTPSVVFDSDITVGTDIVFPDGSRQSTSAVGIPGPTGPIGPTGASGAGTGDVLSAGGSYVDNRIVRYDGTTGTIIQVSSASISDAGLLTATSFSGDGSLITALNATELTSGTIPDARFPATLPASSGANLTALNATQLTSGTIPDARFPVTLPATSGVNLTALNATQLTSGTVPVLRLGASGTRDNTTYLRGDNTWATVSGGGTASDSFATIAVAGQSNVVADSATDTLTIAAGTGISITTDAGTDTVTITNTVTAGATAFTELSDAAGLTVDKIYLPAITMLAVTNSGATAYLFDQYSGNNPTVYAISGTTIAFNLNVAGHPFLIQNGAGTNYNTGLTHVTTAGVVTTGSNAQGKTSGTLYWKIPQSISGTYRYQCSAHAPMVGGISIKDFAVV